VLPDVIAILAIDAAWTDGEPSGVALVAGQHDDWRCLCVAPSYDAFLGCASGTQVDWLSGRFRGTAPDMKKLLAAARSIAGIEVTLIALDMPVATVPFASRRPADDAISKAFGGQGCSTHSPSAKRPGPLGSRIILELSDAGYPLATAADAVGTLGKVIEVYPHPALLGLVGRPYRVPYKVGKSCRYWPRVGRSERITRLLAEFTEIDRALYSTLGQTRVPLPAPHEVSKLAALKRYEDALDALVCAWVAIQYTTAAAAAYGDSTGAIWVPKSSRDFAGDGALRHI
jgi:predicted RNase H-like nuclease